MNWCALSNTYLYN